MWGHKSGLENPDLSADEYSLNVFLHAADTGCGRKT